MSLGKPPRLLSSDTERSCECNLGQAFQMLSGPTMTELLADKNNRIAALIVSSKSSEEMVNELFWTALSRPPMGAELQTLLPPLETSKDRGPELEDILWGLLNSKEFLFRE